MWHPGIKGPPPENTGGAQDTSEGPSAGDKGGIGPLNILQSTMLNNATLFLLFATTGTKGRQAIYVQT